MRLSRYHQPLAKTGLLRARVSHSPTDAREMRRSAAGYNRERANCGPGETTSPIGFPRYAVLRGMSANGDGEVLPGKVAGKFGRLIIRLGAIASGVSDPRCQVSCGVLGGSPGQAPV